MSKYPMQGLTGMKPAHLDWLGGNWKGQQGQDQFEEYWSPLGGGTLMAMFRWLKNHQVWFYEFITVEQAGEYVMMRIKHFFPGMQGWEAKDEAVDFLLVQLQSREAVFLQVNKPDQWLVYRMEAEDKLVSYFYNDVEPVKPEDIFSFMRQES
jgi:hypothetical protein